MSQYLMAVLPRLKTERKEKKRKQIGLPRWRARRQISMTRVVGFLLLSASFTSFPQGVKAQLNYPNWQSCGLDFWSNYKAAQELSNDVPLSKVESSNKEIIARLIGEKGLAFALMTIQVKYAKCMKEVAEIGHSTLPQFDPYRRCANQSAWRTAILVQIDKGVPLENQKATIPASMHGAVDVLNRHAEKSFLNAVILSAESGKECIKQARAAER